MGLNALAGVASARVDLIEIQRESLPVGDCINRLRPAWSSSQRPLAFFAATPTLTSHQEDAEREASELKRTRNDLQMESLSLGVKVLKCQPGSIKPPCI